LTGKARKIIEVSRLARVQLNQAFAKLHAAASDKASVLSPPSGHEDAAGNRCRALEETTSEVRIPGEHLRVEPV
jgi:hypothetical protein